MRRTRKSQNALLKPFKSPSRLTAGISSSEQDVNITTPTRPTLKRNLPSSAPPLKSLLRHTPQGSPTPKRLRTTPMALSARRSSGKVTRRLAPRDPEVQRLMQEKTGLQKQMAQTKEEIALLERALTLNAKGDKRAVDDLVSKWQIACSAACDELFVLLKPVMEAQREAAALGFGPSTEDNNQGYCDADIQRKEQRQQSSEEEESSNNDEGSQTVCRNNDEEEEIDSVYMLKRFGIDPELF
ncbi:hypothetical protein COEREDRAFT_6314 [Coemansia reversa NRRL 1564]|uniref:Swi5-dependent recombination DNA repair protein 1 homolog n=1 Tax=Coemansia reversa (strain ATCC 12441 / NRRL 1564) TaxID=763665 RepID=A0A2G5BHY3_COERN|nr:hypothetical protein COEREDRAFT_6314 [Coemansia reversa NRRL 1564]|eukprot:PIA18605.1 hypothetical protein COEREDRAFT_6314 [Coemansia reversa NRRL 1564]